VSTVHLQRAGGGLELLRRKGDREPQLLARIDTGLWKRMPTGEAEPEILTPLMTPGRAFVVTPQPCSTWRLSPSMPRHSAPRHLSRVPSCGI